MKKHFSISIHFVLLLLFATCDKSRPMPRDSWGFFEAKMNGAKWHKTYKNAYQKTNAKFIKSVNGVSCKDSAMSVVSYLYNSQGALRQELIFSNVPVKKARYIVKKYQTKVCNPPNPGAIFYTSIDDGDVAGDSYGVLTGENSYIQIDEINSDTGEIKGRFQVTMVLEHINYGHFLPDTLRFTEGKFHTKLLD